MDVRHEEIKALVAPYVLGAVPPEEEASVRSHLQTCEECRREAESLGSVTSALSVAVDPVELPDGFVERTMAKLSDERPAPVTAPSRWSRRSFAWVLSGAALVVVALVVALVSLGGGGAPDPDEVAALLDRPGLDLSSDGVQAKVVEAEDGTVFVARGLEDAPDGKTYMLWKMTESCAPNRTGPCTVRAAGTFDAEDGLAIVELEEGSSGGPTYDHAAVTVEDGPVREPTTEPILTSF